MRRVVTLAIATTALAAFAGPLQANADAWHYVRSYGHNWTACNNAGSADVRNGYAGSYDCRNVGPVSYPNFDLWEA
ncbi:hypothetical protein ACXJJ3_17780 [Kribbella sp. WER1]